MSVGFKSIFSCHVSNALPWLRPLLNIHGSRTNYNAMDAAFSKLNLLLPLRVRVVVVYSSVFFLRKRYSIIIFLYPPPVLLQKALQKALFFQLDRNATIHYFMFTSVLLHSMPCFSFPS
jgi:hypothetical protein